MGLSCSCYDIDDAAWYFTPSDDFLIFNHLRRKRCKSCGNLIEIGSYCVELTRFREAKWEVEFSIYGEGPEVPLPSWYLCEHCGEILLNLEALGYCIDPADNMNDLLKEYWELTGFQPKGTDYGKTKTVVD